MNALRLNMLADKLDTVPERKFNMEHWLKGPLDRFSNDPNFCGSSACALGWGTTIPAFCEQGLRMWRGNTKFGEPVWTVGLFDGERMISDKAQQAAMMFFDISHEESEQLFFTGINKTAKQKALEIRRLIKKIEERERADAEYKAAKEALEATGKEVELDVTRQMTAAPVLKLVSSA